MRRSALAVALLGAIMACEDGTAPVPRVVAPSLVAISRFHDVLPLDQLVNNTCAGEVVRVTGELHVFDQVVTMGNGEIRTTFHTNFQDAIGIGQSTGGSYRAASADNATWQGLPPGPPGGPWRTSHEGSLRLIAGRGGESFSWHFVFVVTKEPGSPPQLVVSRSTVTCH